MSQFIEHPKYGRILSFDGLIMNNKRTHCNYCGEPIDSGAYVKHYGMCPTHHMWFVEDKVERMTGKDRLKEISDYRLEVAGINKGKGK
ncbi:hypothetical protein QQ054_31960 [Oscillatoria amoena NRMC-F 0135]|nr:hypothetical protein [Oscillatoria amoena NRMC-F 0135]